MEGRYFRHADIKPFCLAAFLCCRHWTQSVFAGGGLSAVCSEFSSHHPPPSRPSEFNLQTVHVRKTLCLSVCFGSENQVKLVGAEMLRKSNQSWIKRNFPMHFTGLSFSWGRISKHQKWFKFSPGPVNPACWIQFVVSVTAKTARRCSTPPAFPLVRAPPVTPPGGGQTTAD